MPAMPIALTSRLVTADQRDQTVSGIRILTGGAPDVTIDAGILQITPGIASLSEVESCEEWITTEEPRVLVKDGPLTLMQTESLLFAAYVSPDADVLTRTEMAYQRLFSQMASRGFPHALRVWNYLGQIHSRSAEHDRYQAFCVGRARALNALSLADTDMPAATAIGTLHSGIVVYLIAAREPGVGIENPRQISAYRYPPRYSPESPAFARATLIKTDSGSQLLVSGTASIVGHESVHLGDPVQQTQEIIRNLHALKTASGVRDLEPAWLRVYLRDALDRNRVQKVLEEELPSLPPLQWIRGDVCREDLLVEIEGVFTTQF
jgi:chorismate lyase/3-hydroxybenzoate synthase